MLFTHIQQLLQARENTPPLLRGKDLGHLPHIDNAWLRVVNGIIADFGSMDDAPAPEAGEELIDCTHRLVLPGFVDSHTHIVFAAWRDAEFMDRLHGLTYEEIAANGGGILNSAGRLQQTSEDELYEAAAARLREVMALGTTAIEIKSGYGLTTESELKMLRVIRRLKQSFALTIKATFLGAHAFPRNKGREEYLQEIINEMLPAIAQEGLAEYCDVFCDEGFFTVSESRRVLLAAKALGLQLRLHANELANSGGVQLGHELDALSVDHLERVEEAEIALLGKSQTIATMLPGTAFFLGIPYPPARQLIEAGAAVCLASDYNPGSCPSGNLPFLLSLACIRLKMTPEEAINALTVNAAYALQLQDSNGIITKGRPANLIVSKPAGSLAQLPYRFGYNWVQQVYINGVAV